MLIQRIQFKNFLVFHGEQELEFPLDEEHNLVLVLANNNTGKTTVIRALKFLFYNQLPSGERSVAALVNDRAVFEAKTDEAIEAYVEIKFEIDDHTYVFRRSIECEKTATGRSSGNSVLQRFVDRHALEETEDGALQRAFERWIPPTLFNAFFFQGEPLDGKLMEGVDQIHAALQTFFRLERWKTAADNLSKARRFFENKRSELAGQNEEYLNKLERLGQIERLTEDNQTKLTKVRLELQESDRQKAILEEELEGFGDTEESDELIRERDNQKNQLSQIDRQIEQAQDELKGTIRWSKGIPFLRRAVLPARAVLKQLEEDNVLPAEISKPFVERVLKAGHCVCGKVHDDESREEWNRYLKRSLDSNLNDLLMKTLNAVGDRDEDGFLNQSEKVIERLEKLEKRFVELKENRQKVAAAFEVASEAVEAHARPDLKQQIREKLNEINRLNNRIRHLVAKEATIERTIASLGMQRKSAKREADRAKPRGQLAQKIDSLADAIQLCGDLRTRILSFQENLHSIFYSRLKSLVAESYNPYASDQTQAVVDPNTLLPKIVSPQGNVVRATGGGQNTLLSLCYVRALAIVRKEIHDLMREFDVYLGQVDDQAFFIDSPFGTVDPNYTRSICRFLPASSKQVVVFLARQQWDQVKEHLEEKAQKVYTMTLHAPMDALEDLQPEDFDFQFKGSKHRLLKDCESSELRFTQIEEVH